MQKKQKPSSILRKILPRTAFLALLLMAYGSQTEAQESKEKELPRYKWEIATDLLWLIDKNYVQPANVFIRKHITTKNGNLAAWRLRLGLDLFFLRKQQLLSVPVDIVKISNIYPSARIGYEWQKQYGKMQLFYGMDINLEYARKFKGIYQATEISGTDTEELIFAYNAGLVGFVGAKYHFSPRFSISGEANLSINYNHSKLNEIIKGYGADFPDITIDESALIESYFLMGFKPLYVINLSYHF